MMRKISGKSQASAFKHPTKNKTEDIADTLAETFSANSSLQSNNSNSHFLIFKNNAEKQKLNFKSNSEKCNQPFTPEEAIETSHNTVTDTDEIHYGFLKYLSQNSLDYLLTIFNDIWINSKFP